MGHQRHIAILTRQDLEQREETLLGPYAVFSGRTKGRIHGEAPHPFRTEFQRDRDRVIHSSALERTHQCKKKISQEKKVLEKVLSDLKKRRFACQGDIDEALKGFKHFDSISVVWVYLDKQWKPVIPGLSKLQRYILELLHLPAEVFLRSKCGDNLR